MLIADCSAIYRAQSPTLNQQSTFSNQHFFYAAASFGRRSDAGSSASISSSEYPCPLVPDSAFRAMS
jgi:hypothetical protein